MSNTSEENETEWAVGWSELLGLNMTSITKQTLYFNDGLIWVKKILNKRIVVALPALAVILLPSLVEASAPVPRHEAPEFIYSSLMLGERSSQSVIPEPATAWTSSFQGRQFWLKSGAESDRGGSKPSYSGISVSQVRAETAKQNDSDYLPEVFYKHLAEFGQGMLWALFPLWIMWMSETSEVFRPNAEAQPPPSGAREPCRAAAGWSAGVTC